MNIALIANDTKKELMIQLCIAYKGILEKHHLCATGSTGSFLTEATGLEVQKFLSGADGGAQQIGAYIACNEIDLVIFLRDPSSAKEYSGASNSLIHLCDQYNIPVATNIATAEMLILGLQRGDLDWREIIKASQ